MVARQEKRIEGGTVIGIVDEPAKDESKTESAPKKRTRKTKGESE